MTKIHTRQLTTMHTKHLKIQHVGKVNNTKKESTVYFKLMVPRIVIQCEWRLTKYYLMESCWQVFEFTRRQQNRDDINKNMTVFQCKQQLLRMDPLGPKLLSQSAEQYSCCRRLLVCAQTSPDQATLEGSSCTSIMTCTGGCGYSF